MSSAVYHQIFKVAPTALVICDAGGKVIDYNFAAEAIFCGGIGPEVMIADLLDLSESGLQKFETLKQKVLSVGKVEEVFTSMTDKKFSALRTVIHVFIEGDDRKLIFGFYPVSESGSDQYSIIDEAGFWAGIYGRQSQLERTVSDLRLIDRMKTNLLQNLSHELRTPLVAIKGYLDLVVHEKVGEIAPKQKSCLQTALNNADILVELISDLTGYTKYTAELHENELSLFDINELVSSCVEAINQKCQSHDVNISISLRAAPLTVIGSKARLSQVVNNLLSNALKYNRPGGSIDVKTSIIGRREVEVIVADTGVGIRPESLPKIFERYYRETPDLEGDSGGEGLGLHIARDIVSMHGGRIHVSSEHGTGSQFTVRLPLETDYALTEQAVAETAEPIISSGRAAILIEDDEDTRRLLRDIMGLDGIASREFSDARSFASRNKQECADIIFLDLNLPGADGMELINEIKSDEVLKKAALIVVTAHAAEEIKEKALKRGANDFLLKPFTIRELRAKVAALLSEN